MSAASLIKEDGTLVSGANTYVDLVGLAAYCELRGIVIPSDESKRAAALINAMDYLSTFDGRWVGNTVTISQELAWPRLGIQDDRNPGVSLPATYMPKELLAAQCIAAVFLLQDNELMPTIGTGGFVTSEKVGPLATTYERGSDWTGAPVVPLLVSTLRKLTRPRRNNVVDRG